MVVAISYIQQNKEDSSFLLHEVIIIQNQLNFYLVSLTGILIGSFLNVCIYRIPKEKSISYPPSHCPKCKEGLKILDLIPIISYIINKGRCRYCGEKISLQYPLVELLNGLIYLILYIKYGLSTAFFMYALVSSILIVITFIDLRYQIIPNRLNMLSLVTGIVFTLPTLFYGNKGLLINNILGLFIGGGLFLIIALVTKGAMGGGDIKLMGALGFCLGWKYILLISLLSFIIAGVISVILLLLKVKGRKDYIAFGPFIALASLIAMLYGTELIQMYIELWV